MTPTDRRRARRAVLLLSTTASAAVVAAGCAGTPSVGGAPGASPAPNVAWTPPERVVRGQRRAEARAIEAADREAGRDSALVGPGAPDLGARLARLTLADVVDLGLRNNRATRIAWANAQAAAAAYGAERGTWLPTIDADVTGSRVKTAASAGRVAVEQWVFNPSVGLSYLLFDFGGRTGRVASARESMIAASFSHNAAIQDVVLQIQVAYFSYVANRGLLEAQRASLREAQTNLEAAEERRRVGLATIADVLQARTAASRVALDAQTTEGALQTARGALALALGLPANLPYDVDSAAATTPVAPLADSVDAIIGAAVRARPDLAAARAEAEAARARIGVARAARLPSLSLSGNAGRTYTTTIPDGANSYQLQLGLSIPLFSGFSRAYDQRAAAWQAEASAARAEQVRQVVVFDVFRAYYELQTATRRVGTADDLLASAQQSTEVALARYREGVGSVLDLLSAQSALAEARAERIQAQLAWSVALAQLAHDAGILDTRGGSPLRLTTDTTTPR
jgi:outer membrane protein TolC